MTSTSPIRLLARGLFALALLSILAFLAGTITSARADDHIVTSQAMQQQVQNTAATRQQNIDTLNRFLSTPIAERAMQSQHFDAVKVRSAIPALSDAELASLASRANDAQQQFAGGFLGLGMLLIIIIAIVVIIVVVAVH
ncbi:MAG: PA2779 family protein [Acidobacteriaceae bacterium]